MATPGYALPHGYAWLRLRMFLVTLTHVSWLRLRMFLVTPYRMATPGLRLTAWLSLVTFTAWLSLVTLTAHRDTPPYRTPRHTALPHTDFNNRLCHNGLKTPVTAAFPELRCP